MIVLFRVFFVKSPDRYRKAYTPLERAFSNPRLDCSRSPWGSRWSHDRSGYPPRPGTGVVGHMDGLVGQGSRPIATMPAFTCSPSSSSKGAPLLPGNPADASAWKDCAMSFGTRDPELA